MNLRPIDPGTATIIAALIGIVGVIVAAMIYRMRDKRLAGFIGVGTLLLVGVSAMALLLNLNQPPCNTLPCDGSLTAIPTATPPPTQPPPTAPPTDTEQRPTPVPPTPVPPPPTDTQA